MGASTDHELEGIMVHFTGEGVLAGGGRVAGAKTDCVSKRTTGSTLGGMIKCIVSSLSRIETLAGKGKENTYTPTAKYAMSVLGHHARAPILPLNFHLLTSLPTRISHRLTIPSSSPLMIHEPSGLTLMHLARLFT